MEDNILEDIMEDNTMEDYIMGAGHGGWHHGG
jgi:hypothetical protein